MKTLRLIAICAVALFLGHAWAQDKPATSDMPSAAQDVGGSPSMATGESGSALKMTPQQVNRDPVRPQQYGGPGRQWNNTYRAH